MIRPYLLDNSFRHYSWGSLDGIAAFLSRPNAERVPCAEYWMGSHATAPSMVEHDGKRLSLGELISQYPDVLLGANTASRFDGKLPFLFKILSAAAPLSLQVHPDKAQAERGFALEDKAGIHLDSPLRNYKDRNHKPELLTAITAFRALCGFREHGETLALLSSCKTDVLKPAIDVLSESREYPAFYRYLLEMPDRARRELTDVMVRLAHDPHKRTETASPDAGHGFLEALELAGELAAVYPGDVGCLSPFFLNIVDLEPGQSLYLYSGILHTYIKGTGLELMASSDNVLRGGLTDKHIDIPEFLSILDARPYYPSVIQPIPGGCRRIIPTPACDFELSIIESSGSICPLPEGRPSILLCAEGDFRFSHSVDAGEEIMSQELRRGSSFFIPACVESPRIEGRGRCFLASVPDGPEAE